MQAYRITGWGQPPELADVPVPEPGPGEVLVRVAGSGACHSDLHLIESGLIPWPLPFTLGHETAGWVEALGPGTSGFAPGDAVMVYGPWGCGACRRCREGFENYCERMQVTDPPGCGLGRDGGHAEFVLVPHPRYLVPIGDLDPVEAAPLADAALTPYHAVKRSLHVLTPDALAVVIGVGGLGHMAVQILRALAPVRIVAVDVSEERLAQARRLGADEIVQSGPGAVEVVRAATAGRGAELVLDFVGAPETTAIAAQMGSVLGHITVVGLAGGSVPVGLLATPWECSVATTYWGSVVELAEVIALAQRGALRAEVERFPLSKAADAYDRMRAGTLQGRAVIVP
jgi:alcohol dehydrogenase, propanol-preferring